MYNFIKNFIHNESGATAIEYGLIAALVSVTAMAGLTGVGSALADMFTAVSTTIDAAVTP